VGFLFGDTGWGLLAVTNLGFAAYLLGLYQWVKLDCDAPTAERAAFYAAAFPAAFVFATLYSEALFLALVVGVFWSLKCRRFWLAIALACLASLTRITGIATLLPVAYELWRARNWKMLCAALVLIPLGPILYELNLWLLSGDPLAYFTL
jgi:Gpi18-like mannosyltransferase